MSLRIIMTLRSDERGAALLEMALMLPFLFALIFGIFEFGNFFSQYQLVQSGARDAARYLSRVTDTTSTSPCGASGCLTPCDPLVLAEKVGNAQSIAVYGAIGGSTKRVSWMGTGDIAVDYATVIANPMISGYPTYRGPTSGIRIIKVTATPTYSDAIGLLGAIGLGTIKISVQHQERCIGQG